MAMKRTNFGGSLIAAGLILPTLVWFAGKAWLSTQSALDSTPDQGKMVLAWLTFCASLAAAVILGIAGLVLLIRRSPPA
jgi:hypothetical protein